MPTAIVTNEGQTVIPKEIRELLGLRSGDHINFVVDTGGRVYLQPIRVEVEKLKGILYKPGRQPVSIEQMDNAILQNGSHCHYGMSGSAVLRVL